MSMRFYTVREAILSLSRIFLSIYPSPKQTNKQTTHDKIRTRKTFSSPFSSIIQVGYPLLVLPQSLILSEIASLTSLELVDGWSKPPPPLLSTPVLGFQIWAADGWPMLPPPQCWDFRYGCRWLANGSPPPLHWDYRYQMLGTQTQTPILA